MTDFYLSRKEFDKLEIGELETVTLLRRLSNGYSIQHYTSIQVKRTGENKFEENGKAYALKHTETKVQKIEYRKPHPVVKSSWDERVKRINESIREEQSTLEKYVREDLNGISTNLFVRPEYANVLETKIDELRKNLASMTLETEKIKDYYEKVGPDTENSVLPLPPK